MDNFAKIVSGHLKTQPASPHPDPDLLTAFAENALPNRLALRWGTLAASAVIAALFFTTHYWAHRSADVPAPPQPVQIAAEKTPPDIDHLAMGGKVSEAKQEQPAETKGRPPAKHMTAKPQASFAFDSSGQVRVRSAPAPGDVVSSPAGDVSIAKEKPAAASSNTLSPQIEGRDAAISANDSALVSGGAPVRSGGQSTAELDLKKSAPLADSGRADDAALAPKQSAQWMISPQGSLRRSEDSGKTWQMVPVQPGASFRAFSTAGTEVWVGGNAGGLYHSMDSGRSWIRVEPTAAGHKLQANIISVNFSDALKGAITTENGGVWTTSDGGKTWALK